jgi:hypothetical protein
MFELSEMTQKERNEEFTNSTIRARSLQQVVKCEAEM